MNVLMVVGQYHPVAGGTEIECQKLAARLAESGVSVTVLTQHRAGLPDYELINGIPVYRKMRGGHFYEYTYMFSVLRFLLWNIRAYDIIHCFGLYLFIPPVVFIKAIFGKKAIGRIEGSGAYGDFHRIKKLRCGGLILTCACRLDKIVSIASHIGREIEAEGVPGTSIVNIPNSVDHELYRPAGSGDLREGKRICFVGRLAEEKGLHCLINAMKRVSTEIAGVALFIVGEGPMRSALQTLTVDLGLQGTIHFNGSGVALQHYHASDLFVLPSFSEGLSLSLLEAMACGIPVIATDVQGNRGVLDPHGSESAVELSNYRIGECGIMVRPGDTEGLAAAILRLLRDGGLAHQLQSRARSQVEMNYTLNKVIHDYRLLYRSLL